MSQSVLQSCRRLFLSRLGSPEKSSGRAPDGVGRFMHRAAGRQSAPGLSVGLVRGAKPVQLGVAGREGPAQGRLALAPGLGGHAKASVD